MKKTLMGVLLFTLMALLVPSGFPQGTAAGSAKEALEVETMDLQGTVKAVDAAKHKVTLTLEDGKTKTFKVDKAARNLDQVKVGDRVKVSYLEEMAIVVGKYDAPPTGDAGVVSFAPKGKKPGMVTAETSTMTAKILAVDAQKRSVTLQTADGKKKRIKVHNQVEGLDQLKAGDNVTIVWTEALAIDVSAP